MMPDEPSDDFDPESDVCENCGSLIYDFTLDGCKVCGWNWEEDEGDES